MAGAETVLIHPKPMGSFIPLCLKCQQDLPGTCSIKCVSQPVTSYTKLVCHCHTAKSALPKAIRFPFL